MEFCPKCEKILRKKRDGENLITYCVGCDYKEIKKSPRTFHQGTTPPSSSLNHGSDQASLSSSATSHVHTQPSMGSVKLKQYSPKTTVKTSETSLSKIGEEIILLEIKKNKLLKAIENYTGNIKEERILEILSLLPKIQSLQIQYQSLLKQSVVVEINMSAIPPELYISSEQLTSAQTLSILPSEEETSTKQSSIPNLSEGGKKPLNWLETLKMGIINQFPEVQLITDKYWAVFESEIDHFKIGYAYPTKAVLYIIAYIPSKHTEDITSHLILVDSDEKMKVAGVYLHRSVKLINEYQKRFAHADKI